MWKYYWRTGLNSFYKLQRGAIMVFFAILLPLLFGFMGLSIDVGLAYVEHGKVQDIADSAALAGAAHLSDSNRDEAIKAAVKAYVEANGIALQDDDLLKKEFNSWETKESVPAGRQAVVAYGVVAVTNSKGTPVDRVRVRITKRVPVVFMSIVDGIADSFTVSAKAAAEGGGEEAPVVTYSGPRIMAERIDFNSIDDNTIKVKKGDDFSVFAYSDIAYKGLPKNATGTVYSTSQNYDSIPNGYQLVAVGKGYHYTSEAEEKASKAAMALHQQKMEQYSSTLTQLLEDVESYKRGDGNKRYIGQDIRGHWGDGGVYIVDDYITNIKDTDTTDIDLYFDVSEFSGLTNDLLKNITYVKRLVIAHKKYVGSIIGTKKVRYGDIYSKHTLHLAGKQNYFDGLVYTGDQLYLVGEQNRFWSSPVSSEAMMFSSGPAHFGYGNEIKNATQPTDNLYKGTGWHIFVAEDGEDKNGNSGKPGQGEKPDSGSGESGSSGEGSSATGKLRLVEQAKNDLVN